MSIDYKKLYLKCFEEKKVLKKENKELKDKLDCVEADLEEQSNILCEVKEENEKLTEELEGKGTGIYIGDMVCSYCPTAITEDDLYMSLECGELRCERCMDKKKKEKLKQELGKKETLHYYACMWHVTGCDDTPTKEEIEDYLYRNVLKEDKEEVKQELWEQFGHEEEEESEEELQ